MSCLPAFLFSIHFQCNHIVVGKHKWSKCVLFVDICCEMVYKLLVAVFPKCYLWTECKFFELLYPLSIKISLFILIPATLSLWICVTLIYQILIDLPNTGVMTQQWLPYIHAVLNVNGNLLKAATKSILSTLITIPSSRALPACIVPFGHGPVPLLSGSAQQMERDRFKVSTGPEAGASRG